MRKLHLVGQKFYDWLVIAPALPKKNETYWLCRCKCGKEIEVGGKNLRYGRSKSCGCATKEMHGRSYTIEYATFRGMVMRCTNPNNKNWHLYGGKGVKVEWKSFDSFHRDMGDRPSRLHSIDRINGDGNYSKTNCRWATAQEQARNMKVNRLITANGITHCLAKWAEITGISRNCIEKRIDLLGWSPHKALTTPVQVHVRHENLAL
jgi:hypothetical protein